MKKKVLILNEGEPTKEFRPSKGEYRKQLKHFEDQGYEIIQKNIKDPETEIPSLLEGLTDQSLAFVWPRMHGSPKSMAAYEDKVITSENLQKIFALLPEKLMSNAIIFLDSCSTGKLISDFYNNIQFTFAKLTRELPDVQIVAPSENMAIYTFTFEAGIFNCRMASHPGGSTDMAITVGAKTKKLISKTYGEESSPLIAGSEVLLLKSIIKNEGYYSPSAYYKWKSCKISQNKHTLLHWVKSYYAEILAN